MPIIIYTTTFISNFTHIGYTQTFKILSCWLPNKGFSYFSCNFLECQQNYTCSHLLLILKILYSVNRHFSFFTSFFIQMYCFFFLTGYKYLKYFLPNSWFWTFYMIFIWDSEVHNWSMKSRFFFCFAVYIVFKMIFATECCKFIFLHFLLIKIFVLFFLNQSETLFW